MHSVPASSYISMMPERPGAGPALSDRVHGRRPCFREQLPADCCLWPI